MVKHVAYISQKYTIQDHKHCFASWAAARAASSRRFRFSVKDGRDIIEKSGLRADIEKRRFHYATIDTTHRMWRKKVIHEAKKKKLKFTNGIAAKLINVYLKSYFVCGGYEKERDVASLHPPIDRFLLNNLKRKRVGGKTDWNAVPWTQLNTKDYESLIKKIREVTKGKMWTIEKYWCGDA